MPSRFYWFNKETQTFEEGHPPPSGFSPNLGVLTDEMPNTLNHADGNTYTSKHKFRDATRRAGYVEVGNEKMKAPKDNYSGGVKQDLIRTFNEKGYFDGKWRDRGSRD